MERKRLILVATRVGNLLQKYGQSYGRIFAELLLNFRDQPYRLREEISKLYEGTMGSLTDIWISKLNGHRVEHEKEANLEIGALLDVLWDEVKDPKRNQVEECNLHLLKVLPKRHEDVQDAFAADNLELTFDLLVRVTYCDPDWRWVQQQCLDLTYHANPEVRKLAVSCLIDLARLHEDLDGGVVLARLGELMNDPELKPTAEKALAEINSVLNVTS
jgi:hypothetical protein